MKIEDAKQKWCPFARSYASHDSSAASINREWDGSPDNGTMCIADRCMAWRELRDNGVVTGGCCGLVK